VEFGTFVPGVSWRGLKRVIRGAFAAVFTALTTRHGVRWRSGTACWYLKLPEMHTCNDAAIEILRARA
jgi:hypothetical protein